MLFSAQIFPAFLGGQAALLGHRLFHAVPVQGRPAEAEDGDDDGRHGQPLVQNPGPGPHQRVVCQGAGTAQDQVHHPDGPGVVGPAGDGPGSRSHCGEKADRAVPGEEGKKQGQRREHRRPALPADHPVLLVLGQHQVPGDVDQQAQAPAVGPQQGELDAEGQAAQGLQNKQALVGAHLVGDQETQNACEANELDQDVPSVHDARPLFFSCRKYALIITRRPLFRKGGNFPASHFRRRVV